MEIKTNKQKERKEPKKSHKKYLWMYTHTGQYTQEFYKS